jgi:hypothetical protein
MAVTMVVMVVAQVVMPFWGRAHLITPVQITVPLDTSAIKGFMIDDNGGLTVTGRVKQPDAWVVANETITSTGQVFDGPGDATACGPSAARDACTGWMGTLGLRQHASYVPGDRFWTLQWRETALFLGLAALLSGFCFWWIRRRLT